MIRYTGRGKGKGMEYSYMKVFTRSIIFLFCFLTYGQDTTSIIVPPFNDKYSNYVRKLEAGKTNIDFQDFRFSFLDSEQYDIAQKKSTEFSDLTNQMYEMIDAYNYNEVINITKKMLSIDYTSMRAHKILRQTYNIVGDTINDAKYKAIQFGLLESIVQKGTGKTCEEAWTVIQISEEYFILEMIGAEFKKQSVDNKGGLCDKMEVEVDGEQRTYYFDVTKLFEKY